MSQNANFATFPSGLQNGEDGYSPSPTYFSANESLSSTAPASWFMCLSQSGDSGNRFINFLLCSVYYQWGAMREYRSVHTKEEISDLSGNMSVDKILELARTIVTILPLSILFLMLILGFGCKVNGHCASDNGLAQSWQLVEGVAFSK